MSIGTFTLIKNEAPWIAAHLLRILPFVDRCVLFDGNSTDGTLEIIKAIRAENKHGHKIKLFEDRDPKDLEGDYVRLFNECLRSVDSDLAYFAHPDFYVVNPQRFLDIRDSGAVALSTRMRSFAGNPGGPLLEIKGRGESWKNIYRLRNPDLGAHYAGFYGAPEEDIYFSAITGDEHIHHGTNFAAYPYEVEDSGIEVFHYSDVRTPKRRHERMVKCLINQGLTVEAAERAALEHPRVTLKDGYGFRFEPAEYPADFLTHYQMYASHRMKLHQEHIPANV